MDRNTERWPFVKAVFVALRKESVDRNTDPINLSDIPPKSLSARRAWIEMFDVLAVSALLELSLSARRAWIEILLLAVGVMLAAVALRKESVDRNFGHLDRARCHPVALRKESVDRNARLGVQATAKVVSLSARRAWIEIDMKWIESYVNQSLSARRAWIEILVLLTLKSMTGQSLSARRAWIEILNVEILNALACVALRKESVDRNSQAL